MNHGMKCIKTGKTYFAVTLNRKTFTCRKKFKFEEYGTPYKALKSATNWRDQMITLINYCKQKGLTIKDWPDSITTNDKTFQRKIGSQFKKELYK